MPEIPCLHQVIILCDTNNINKNSSFDIAECRIEIGTHFQERSLNVKLVISGILPRGQCWFVSKIIISKINDILVGKCFLQGVCFIYQKYGWTGENAMLNPNLYFKGNVHLFGQRIVRLASQILAAANGNTTSPLISPHKHVVNP